jgi:hypothetical protein
VGVRADEVRTMLNVVLACVRLDGRQGLMVVRLRSLFLS